MAPATARRLAGAAGGLASSTDAPTTPPSGTDRHQGGDTGTPPLAASGGAGGGGERPAPGRPRRRQWRGWWSGTGGLDAALRPSPGASRGAFRCGRWTMRLWAVSSRGRHGGHAAAAARRFAARPLLAVRSPARAGVSGRRLGGWAGRSGYRSSRLLGRQARLLSWTSAAPAATAASDASESTAWTDFVERPHRRHRTSVCAGLRAPYG